MPRRPDYVRGHYYHFYNRGIQRMSLFREPDNYLYVLQKAKQYSRELDISVIAYCLLPNHYHFLVRQDSDTPASLIIQRTFNGYVKAYNRRYGSSGTLFEGPYKAKDVHDEAYALTLSRYIHANPVLHGIVPYVIGWPYSNYLEWTGERTGTLVDHSFVKAYYPDPADYAATVADYLAEHAVASDLE
jgi:REP element-mobilizing transposase RayT